MLTQIQRRSQTRTRFDRFCFSIGSKHTAQMEILHFSISSQSNVYQCGYRHLGIYIYFDCLSRSTIRVHELHSRNVIGTCDGVKFCPLTRLRADTDTGVFLSIPFVVEISRDVGLSSPTYARYHGGRTRERKDPRKKRWCRSVLRPQQPRYRDRHRGLLRGYATAVQPYNLCTGSDSSFVWSVLTLTSHTSCAYLLNRSADIKRFDYLKRFRRLNNIHADPRESNRRVGLRIFFFKL